MRPFLCATCPMLPAHQSEQPPSWHHDKGHTTVAGMECFDVHCDERLKSLMTRAAGKPRHLHSLACHYILQCRSYGRVP